MADVKIGAWVKVDHPQTVANPDEYFQVMEMRYNWVMKKISIRGENTCWFNANMIIDVKEERNVCN